MEEKYVILRNLILWIDRYTWEILPGDVKMTRKEAGVRETNRTRWCNRRDYKGVCTDQLTRPIRDFFLYNQGTAKGNT